MINKILIALSILFLTSCSKDENDSTLYFVDDSMIANWDVEASFPNRITRNMGKDGAQLNYIEGVRIPEGEVVMLIGTNDLHADMNDDQVKAYAEKYESSALSMSAGRILLVSVLPTNNPGKNINIKRFNTIIKQWSYTVPRIKFVDCYDRFLDDDDLLKSDLTREGLHLNDYGYIILTGAVQSIL